MKHCSSPVSKQFSPMENRFRIECDRDDVRIDTYLSEKLSLTRTKVQSLIDKGHVRVCNKTPKASLKVRRHMEIEGEVVEEEKADLLPEEIPLAILYEDDYLLAINKTKGMVVHPSFGHNKGTLVNAVLSYLKEPEQFEGKERPGIVHRLDKDTTGVILVARDSRTQEKLSRQFHDRNVEKVYRAVVEGQVKDDEGAIEGNIGRHPKERKKMALVQKGGRHSLSRYKTIRKLKNFSYLEIYPETGRTHQIRVHLSHIGHPVVGDPLYGKRAKTAAERPLLHAYRLSFEHPVSGKRISVEAPIPEDMERFVGSHAE